MIVPNFRTGTRVAFEREISPNISRIPLLPTASVSTLSNVYDKLTLRGLSFLLRSSLPGRR